MRKPLQRRTARILALFMTLGLLLPATGCDENFLEDFYTTAQSGLESGVNSILSAIVSGAFDAFAPNADANAADNETANAAQQAGV